MMILQPDTLLCHVPYIPELSGVHSSEIDRTRMRKFLSDQFALFFSSVCSTASIFNWISLLWVKNPGESNLKFYLVINGFGTDSWRKIKAIWPWPYPLEKSDLRLENLIQPTYAGEEFLRHESESANVLTKGGKRTNIRISWPWSPSLSSWANVCDAITADTQSGLIYFCTIMPSSANPEFVDTANEYASALLRAGDAQALSGSTVGLPSREVNVQYQMAGSVYRNILLNCYQVFRMRVGLLSSEQIQCSSGTQDIVKSIIGAHIAEGGFYHENGLQQVVTFAGYNSKAVDSSILITPFPNAILQASEWLQQIYTIQELQAAFRLPFAEKQGLPGVRIHYIGSEHFSNTPINENLQTDTSSIKVGSKILRDGRRLPTTIHKDALTHHSLVVGRTGSGKTTTCKQILLNLSKMGIPFLVIEPVKREYWALCSEVKNLRIFTPGNPQGATLRLNPLEVPEGIIIQSHIDRVKAIFTASISMWEPLPSLLGHCLNDVYQEKAIDSITVASGREIWPTLADLYLKIPDVVSKYGYEGRIQGNLVAAFRARIHSLITGSKGQIFNTRRSDPFENLYNHPVVIELSALPDNDDKAFIMGVLLSRLYEELERRSYLSELIGESPLKHITLIEEAHRLLSNTATGITNPELANSRSNAVGTFCDMLAEVRAYGEGFIIVEQIPSKLAPDILKNTVTKIAHALSTRDERLLMAGTLNLDPDEEQTLLSLSKGDALFYTEGIEKPIQIRVDKPSIKSISLENRIDLLKQSQWVESDDVPVIPKNGYPSDLCAHCIERCAHYDAVIPYASHHKLIDIFQIFLDSLQKDKNNIEGQIQKLSLFLLELMAQQETQGSLHGRCICIWLLLCQRHNIGWQTQLNFSFLYHLNKLVKVKQNMEAEGYEIDISETKVIKDELR